MAELAPAVSAADFRRALGLNPTGVAVIMAKAAEGEPVAMVVGTFTSVSLDPPLVGFLPDRASTSWPRIREAGSFCVSVLAANQEHVCRAFFTKAQDRFDVHTEQRAPSGNPSVVGAVLWVDCEIEDVLPAGDHELVLGRVRDLGVPPDAGLPLLFVRGGYGSPSLPSIQVAGSGLGGPLRLADLVRSEAEAVANDLDLECLVSAAVDDAVVSLAAAGIGSGSGAGSTRVGATFPLAAPFAPLFVAWSDAREQAAWQERGRRLTGRSDDTLGQEQLQAVRELGYDLTTGQATADRFERSVTDEDADRADVLRELAERGPEPGLGRPIEELSDVTSLAAPVRDHEGRVVLTLHLIGFTGSESPQRLRECLDRLLVGAERATQLVGS